MKLLRSYIAILGLFGLTTFTACSPDWGEADPPAANQTYPTLEELKTAYSFEYEEGVEPLSEFNLVSGELVEVVQDDTLGSNVLHLGSGSYVRTNNPFKGTSLQTGAGIAFKVKTEEFSPYAALMTIGGEPTDSCGKFFFTANSHLSFTPGDPQALQSKSLDVNNPASVKTNAISGGSWHYVALQVKTDGFVMYVDGVKEAEQTFKPERETQFKYQDIIDHLMSAPYLYIAAGNDSTLCDAKFDDIKFYRNEMTEKQWNQSIGGGAGGEGAFEYIVGDPITTVGPTDCSAAWWTEFSNYFRIPANGSMKFKFTNHTNGVGNWNNWVIALTTDDDRGGSDYLEYLVLRSDLWGWGDAFGSGAWTSEGYGDWDAFRADMEGAVVEITVSRSGETTVMDAVATAPNGTVYHETFTAKCGTGDDVMRAFFVMDGSWIQFDLDGTVAQTPVDVPTTDIGTSDCSAGWWTSFSDYFQIPAGQNLHLGFENHTSGANNWNNWNLCVSTDDIRGGADYLEYFVIRSDLFGWGDSYGSGTWTSEGYDDWDAFRANMEGANVCIDITRDGENVTVDAVATCPNNHVYHETFATKCGDGTQTLSSFLIVDGSYLKMIPSDCYLYTPLLK